MRSGLGLVGAGQTREELLAALLLSLGYRPVAHSYRWLFFNTPIRTLFFIKSQVYSKYPKNSILQVINLLETQQLENMSISSIDGKR